MTPLQISKLLSEEGTEDGPDLEILILNGNPESITKAMENKNIKSQIIEYATKYIKFFNSGKSRKEHITENDVDPQQLEMGIKVELEHMEDETVAKKIALDHLAEIKDYYTRLAKMEKEAE